jgi:hypothetical protein
MRTCGTSLDEGDSGGGTYAYFDPKFISRVQIAVNSWKKATGCGNASEKASEMAGLWNAQSFIHRWHGEYKRKICGIHLGIAPGKCRNRELPGTMLVQ